MKWYYADGGRQVGPVEDAQLDELVRSGAVRDDTLVWREGMASWQAHSAVRGPSRPAPMPVAPVMAPPPPAAPAPVYNPPQPAYGAAPVYGGAPAAAVETRFCSECGRPHPMNELVMIGSNLVCGQCKPLYMQRMREGGQPIGVVRYAGFWIRFVAFIIDGLILGVVGSVVSMPLRLMIGVTAVQAGDPTAALPAMFGLLGLSMLINIALGVAYFGYLNSTKGATFGKMALGLKIIHPDGSGLSFGQAAGRFLLYYLDMIILYIGFIIAGFDSEKRALHDRIMNTRVIKTR
jgi:uncharacterized RDD family membrane protein YckC